MENVGLAIVVAVGIALVVIILVMSRSFAMWMFGIDDILKEMKRNSDLLEKLTTPPSPPVETPTIEQPKRNRAETR